MRADIDWLKKAYENVDSGAQPFTSGGSMRDVDDVNSISGKCFNSTIPDVQENMMGKCDSFLVSPPSMPSAKNVRTIPCDGDGSDDITRKRTTGEGLDKVV